MDRRTMICRPTRFRAAEKDGAPYIEGHFAVFGGNYQIGPDLSESIAPGAFASCLDDDVRALTNHDTTLVLGRTKAGTLELREDSEGLWGRIRINREDGDAMNLYRRVERGDVDQCSFGFTIGEEATEFGENGSIHWTITRVDTLYEVSVVTFPAYENTEVSARADQAQQLKARTVQAWRERMNKKLKGDH